jgi:hypothetical protein
VLAHLAVTAAAAEDLRARHPGRVTLLLGSEFSLTSPGMIPGPRAFTQAAYLAELIDLYAAHGVHGCFVFAFAMADFPHHADPGHDLDMAGLGVVKVSPRRPFAMAAEGGVPEVARRYGGS